MHDEEAAALLAENAQLKAELEGVKFFKTLWDEAKAEARTRQGFIRHTIWFMWKPGEQRTYALTTQPTGIWAAIQKKDGFFIASFEIEVPDTADFTTGIQARIDAPQTELPAPVVG